MDFNNLVKSKREACKLSLEELSKITNISESMLEKIEDGSALPSLEGLMSICRALKSTPNEMLLNVSFDYQKRLREYRYGVRPVQQGKDVKYFSRDEKIQYVTLLKKRKENIYISLIQRKLGVSYREAKELLEDVDAKE